ncbi:MAG: PAS domain S-box protein [Ignavibacteriales bacterium]|nr:PAS domain S-box protein [Ignavibacteriales bacterium]
MIIIGLLQNLSILVALSVLSGFIDLKFKRTKLKGKIFQGLLFGTTAIIGMLSSFVLSEGIIFDGRSIVISLCTLFFGPISGTIAAVLSVTYRLYIGGSGTLMGALVILSSFLIGLLFFYWKNKSFENKITKSQLYVLGLLVHIIMLLLIFVLPFKDIIVVFKAISLTVIVVYPFFTVLIGKILLDHYENQIFVKKLKESEIKFRRFFEATNDGIIIISAESGKVMDVNPFLADLAGYAKEELIGKYLWEIGFTNNKISNKEILLELQENENMRYTDLKLKKKDGSLVNIEFIANGYTVDNAKVIQCNIHDITIRKIAEEALLESEEKFRSLVTQSPDGIFIVDLEGKFLSVNKVMCEMLKYSEDEFNSMKIWNIIPKEFFDQHKKRFEKILLGESQNDAIEYVAVGKDGKKFWIEVRSAPYLKENKVSGFLGIARNVTERKQSEKEIKMLAHSIKSISECISITDEKNKIIFVNEAFLKTYDYTEKELIGENISIVRPRDTKIEIPADILSGTLKGGWRGEVVNRRKDGTEFPVHLSTSVIKDDNDKPIALIGVATDITNTKKTMVELIQAKEKAEEMNRIKSNFLANMSHELRTPMVGILGFTDILNDELVDPEHRLMVQTIRTNSVRLMRTLNLLLDLSRIESNREEIKFENVNVSTYVQIIIDSFDSVAKNKNLKLIAEIKNMNVIAQLDERIFDQVLNNLVNNALKFTEHGSVTIQVDIETINGKLCAVVKVIDTGIGIAKENLEIIFKEFRQVSEGFSRSYEGTGLGLTITKRSVEIMNGTITVESTEGVGSTFIISFPALEMNDNLSETFNVKEVAIAENNIENFFGKILIVENDKICLEFFQHTLKSFISIDIAVDGTSAINLAVQNNYSLIFMEINLGIGINGIKTTAEIRKLPGYEKTPIIALTGYAMYGDKEHFLLQGFTRYLSKPYTRKEILNLISEVLANK